MNITRCYSFTIEKLPFLSERHLKGDGGNIETLSFYDESPNTPDTELMIFLSLSECKESLYEVRIYKNNPADKYVPHESDRIFHYEENDEYATFLFDNFKYAKNFITSLQFNHKEYRERPWKKE